LTFLANDHIAPRMSAPTFSRITSTELIAFSILSVGRPCA
jgi:hypothetical protein